MAIEVGVGPRSQDVIVTLSRLRRLYGELALIRSDNRAEFAAAKLMRWQRDAAQRNRDDHRKTGRASPDQQRRAGPSRRPAAIR
ncbi:integrase [Burkholderia oklahomensis EO147]|nr:integrase [Burkholderia oklahomensis EO147]KUY51738.1 integrase [Burkholderia oklahomensis EO147]